MSQLLAALLLLAPLAGASVAALPAGPALDSGARSAPLADVPGDDDEDDDDDEEDDEEDVAVA